MLLELSVELIQPLLIAKIIDEGILAGDISIVYIWGSAMMGLAFVAFFSGIINSYFAAHAAQSFAFDLRSALFRKMQAFSLATFLRFSTSSLITRLTSDITMVQSALFMGLRIMLRAPLLVIGSLVMSFFVNAHLALYLLIGAPVLVVFLFFMSRKGIHFFGKIQRRLDGVNRIIQENLQAIRLVKAYLRGSYEASRFAKVANYLQVDTVKALRLMELIMPVLLFMMNMSLMAVLWFGSKDIQQGQVKVGELVAVVNYAMRMTGAFSMFAFLIIIYSRAKASAERMEEVLDQNEVEEMTEVIKENTRLNGAIVFENVSFTYPQTNTPVLKNVSFEVKAGEKLAILGATGSGKSTLLNLIPRLFEVTDGTIMIDGVNNKDIPLSDLRHSIGLVPQQSILFTGTILENIAWGNQHAAEDELIEAAKKAQIHQSIETFPEKYTTRVGQKGVNLSGGQKQRLSIARALVRKPSILLFDDSTSALDIHTEQALWKALEDEQATMFVITQKITTAQGADKILLLDEGRIVGYGTHDQLLKESVLYQEIERSQRKDEVGQ